MFRLLSAFIGVHLRLQEFRELKVMSIELTRVEEFALITLNRPEALNALSFALIADLGRAFDEVAGSDARAAGLA